MQKRSVLTGLCIFLAIFFLTIPLFSYAQKDPAKPAKTESTPATPTAEVRFDGKVLFEIKERILSFSPEDRARAITERLDALTRDSLLRIEEIKAADFDEGAAISYGQKTIMTITDKDARVAGKPRLTLAQEYAEKIRNAIKEKQARYSFRSILFGVLFMFISTAVLIAILILFKRIFPIIYGIVHSWKGTRIRSIVIQAFEALSADRLVAMLITWSKASGYFSLSSFSISIFLLSSASSHGHRVMQRFYLVISLIHSRQSAAQYSTICQTFSFWRLLRWLLTMLLNLSVFSLTRLIKGPLCFPAFIRIGQCLPTKLPASLSLPLLWSWPSPIFPVRNHRHSRVFPSFSVFSSLSVLRQQLQTSLQVLSSTIPGHSASGTVSGLATLKET